MKRIGVLYLSVLLLVVFGLTLAGCAPAAKAPSQIVIGWSGPTELDPYQTDLANGANARAAALGVKLAHLEQNYDNAKQAADIEDLIAQKVDFLLVGAADANAVVPSIQAAVAAGIPTMTFDQGANEAGQLGHSGNDNYCMGYRSMEYLVQLLGGKGKVLHITGVAGMQLVQWNADAVKAVVAKNPGIELVFQGYADWDPAKGLAITEDTLTAHPDLAGIYVHSSAMSGGVIQALEARDLIGKIPVVSGSWDQQTQDQMAKGQIVGTIEYKPYAGGEQGIQLAYDYLVNGKTPAKWTSWPMTFHYADGSTEEVQCPIEGWTP